jgi:hypothetical protein
MCSVFCVGLFFYWPVVLLAVWCVDFLYLVVKALLCFTGWGKVFGKVLLSLLGVK